MIRAYRFFGTILLSFMFLTTLYSSLFSTPISVKEVQTYIFEKEVIGYRLTLPQSRPILRQGIRDWLSSYQTIPATFDDILIYENITYPPITETKDITLYYMVKDVEGVFTELTIVGMYDYQNSINSSQYPDLTLRMLLDLSKMVEAVSGEHINFDPIFAQTNAKEVLAKYEARKEQQSLDFFIDRKDNQIEDFGETSLKHDPFTEENPTSFESEDQIVTEIALRFDDYIERSEPSSPFVEQDKLTERRAFVDSISSLYKKISTLQESLVQQQSNLLTAATQLEASMAEPEIIRDTVFIESREQIEYWQDSVVRMSRDMKLRKKTIDHLQDQITELQLAQKPEVIYVHDTLVVPVIDRQENLVLTIENQSLMDSLLIFRTKLENQSTAISTLQDDLAIAEANASSPSIIRDTLRIEVPVEDTNLKFEMLAERLIWKDSLRQAELLVLAQQNENARLAQELSELSNRPAPLPEQIIVHDTIRYEVEVENLAAQEALNAQNQVLLDSLAKKETWIAAQKKEIDLANVQLLAQRSETGRIKQELSELSNRPAPLPEQIIVHDTIRYEVEVENLAAQETLNAQNQVLLDSLAKKETWIAAQRKDMDKLRLKLEFAENQAAVPTIVRDTVFVEAMDAEIPSSKLKTRAEIQTLQQSLTETKKTLIAKELELDELRDQLLQAQVARQPEPIVLHDTLLLRDTVLVKEIVEADSSLTKKLVASLSARTQLEDSLSYIGRINRRLNTLLEERQTRIEVLQGQVSWIQSQPAITKDTVYVEVPTVDKKAQALYAQQQRQLADSLSNLRFGLLEREGNIQQLKEELKVALSQPQQTDTVQIVDQQALQQLRNANKHLGDSLSRIRQDIQIKTQQLAQQTSEVGAKDAQIQRLNGQLAEALDQSEANNQLQQWQDSVGRMQQKLAQVKQIIADRKDQIQHLKAELTEIQANPTVVHDTIEVEVFVEAPQPSIAPQIDSLSRIARHWRIKANDTDSLLSDQTKHIGRLISVINNHHAKEDSLSELVILQTAQLEQSLIDDIRNQKSQDSLAQVSIQWEWKYESLRDSIASNGLSSSLSSAAKEFQQEFFEDRISQLTQAQQALVQKEWKIESQIKRIQQREKFLIDHEDDGDESKLLSRIHELESELKLAEEVAFSSVDMPEQAHSGLEIQAVYLFRNDAFLPAYSVKTPYSSNQITIRVRNWFQKRSFKPSRGGKLFFEQVIIPELTKEPLDIAFEIIDQDTEKLVLVSAKRKDGTFVSGETGDLDGLRIRRLLYDLFWLEK